MTVNPEMEFVFMANQFAIPAVVRRENRSGFRQKAAI
jgi:hypothetical protein